MLWIILTVILTIVVLRFGRRFPRFPTHLLGVEGYEWADDFLNWTLLHYEWERLYTLVVNSIQEEFKKRAQPGWTLKFEGYPSFPINSELAKRSFARVGNVPRVEALPIGSEVTANQISSADKREQVAQHSPPTVLWSNDLTNVQTKTGIIENIKRSSEGHAFNVTRIQALGKNPREIALAVDVKFAGWSHDVFITCRHANQLESIRCPVNLIKLTGKIKLHISDVPNEKLVYLSVGFDGVPSINIATLGTSFQKEGTLLTLERLLKESISNFNVKLPLFDTTSQEKNLTNSELRIVSHLPNLRGAPLKEEREILSRPNTLVIKVLKANALYDKGNYEIECMVTVDSPSQSQKTSSVADSPNPFFDELLTFRLDETTRKVLFVVQDKNKTSVPVGKAELLLKDVQHEIDKSKRIVLPLMGQRPNSCMSLTIDVTSARSEQHGGLDSWSRNEKRQINDIRPNQMTSLSSVLKPSINIETLPTSYSQRSDQSLRLSSRKSPAHTDSNLSLASQTSLMARNNSRESSGPPKHRSLIDAMKKRFRGKNSRSRSVEPSSKQARDESPSANKVFSDGIYLTPPPRRVPPSSQMEQWSLSSTTALASDGQIKKRGKISSFKNLFRKKGRSQTASPKHSPGQAVQQ